MDKERYRPRPQMPYDATIAQTAFAELDDAVKHGDSPRTHQAVIDLDLIGEATKPGILHGLRRVGKYPQWKQELNDAIDAAKAAGNPERVQELVRVAHLMGLTEGNFNNWLARKLVDNVPDPNERFRVLFDEAQQEIDARATAAAAAAPPPSPPQTPGPNPVGIPPAAATPVNPATAPATGPTTPDITQARTWPTPEPLTSKSSDWQQAITDIEQRWASVGNIPTGTGHVPDLKRYTIALNILQAEIESSKSAPAASKRVRPMIEYLLATGKIWKEPRVVKRFLRDHISGPRGQAPAQTIDQLKEIVRATFVPESLRGQTGQITQDQAQLIKKIYRTFQLAFHPDRKNDMAADVDSRLDPMIEILHNFVPLAWKEIDDVVKNVHPTQP